jgi:hypothetical protein
LGSGPYLFLICERIAEDVINQSVRGVGIRLSDKFRHPGGKELLIGGFPCRGVVFHVFSLVELVGDADFDRRGSHRRGLEMGGRLPNANKFTFGMIH